MAFNILSGVGMNFSDFGDGTSDFIEQMIKSESFIPNMTNLLTDSLIKGEPYLEILVQPKARGYRFRYSSEGNTHGGVPGEGTEKGNKKYPTVHICNYQGEARICVSLVTGEEPYEIHAHNLVGKDTNNGFCLVKVTQGTNMAASFQNLGIQHVTKKLLLPVLINKLTTDQQITNFSSNPKKPTGESFDILKLVDSFGPEPLADPDFGIVVQAAATIQDQAKRLADSMDLSMARLKFLAFLPDELGNYTKPLPAIVSQCIYDQKAVHAGQLKITRVSRSTSSVQGGKEVILLCDKVQKEDIQVRFYQETENGAMTWEDFGVFSLADVHKQCAIVFTTPPYWDKAIQKPVDVLLQLKRKKDQECSEPISFKYKPEKIDKYRIGEKRRKTIPKELDEIISQSTTTASTSSASFKPIGMDIGNVNTSPPKLNFTGINFFQPNQQRSAIQMPGRLLDTEAIQNLLRTNFRNPPKSSS